MVIAILLLLHAWLLTFVYGRLSFRLASRFLDFDHHLPAGLDCILGMAVLSALVAIPHFFSPVNEWMLLAVWLLPALFYSHLPDVLRQLESWRPLWWAALVLLFASAIAVISRPGSGDIADYHLQAIRWAEYYKNIIGLGNFNRPLANNNWWFNLEALVGFRFAGIHSVYVMNGVLFSSVVLYFFSAAHHPYTRAFRAVALLFVALSVKTAFVGSVTPDYVITLIIFLCIHLYLESCVAERDSRALFFMLSLIIAWAITIKVTILLMALLLVPMVLRLHRQRALSLVWICSASALIVYILPWLVGNVIACGYLLYPLNSIDLFNVDWKVPGFYFDYDRIVLKGWGRIPGNNVFETARLGFADWMPVWFSKLDAFNKSLVVLFAAASPVAVVKSIRQPQLLWAVIVLLAGFAALFLNGPHPRFLYGYMVSIAGLAAAMVYLPAHRIRNELYLLVVALLSVFTLYRMEREHKLAASWNKPLPYPTTMLKEKAINGFRVFITSSNNACWDTFPCSYYFIYTARLRGKDVREGFAAR
jgi:hypothetical protein